MEHHLTIEELMERTRQSRGALAQMRHLGTGPRFVKFGRRVLYPESSVIEFLQQHTMTKTGRAA